MWKACIKLQGLCIGMQGNMLSFAFVQGQWILWTQLSVTGQMVAQVPTYWVGFIFSTVFEAETNSLEILQQYKLDSN